MGKDDIRDEVRDYYGKELQKSEDLKTNACCTAFNYPDHIKKAMANIHDEVMSKYYGCGLTIPTTLEGMKILDLGSGSGRDCYLLSQLVGEEGEVVGVDMTDEQLEVSNRHIDWHKEKFGYKKSNVRFIKGYLEDLDKLGLEENYFDIIISNCVINLVKDKELVLSHAFKLLKDGGEMYFSDVYVDRRIPKSLQDDPVLYGECLSGALYWNDFINISKKVGFLDPRNVESAPITIENADIQKKLFGYEFKSVTARLFKHPNFDRSPEDYGQAVKYLGGIEEQEQVFMLDKDHFFEKGRVEKASGNTVRMLKGSRLEKYFEFYGTFCKHFGPFGLESTTLKLETTKGTQADSGSGCC